MIDKNSSLSTKGRSWLILLILSVCMVGLSACSALPGFVEPDDDLRGALLIWHNWSETDAHVIEQLLDDFMNIHPRVELVTEYVHKDELRERFDAQSSSGLGPDLLIGADLALLLDWAQDGQILNLSPADISTETLMPEAVDALKLNGRLYGVPFAAYTTVLYYNKDLITEPAATLDALIVEVQDGNQVALPISFQHAYWGVRAHNGELFDNTNGNILLSGAYVEWLDWLQKAQSENVLLSNDYQALQEQFTTGKAAYFVGSSTDLPILREALGSEQLGVGLLPPKDLPTQEERLAMLAENRFTPGAFLELEVMSVNSITAQKTLALEVVKFFVNQTHQRELGQSDLGKIPLNNGVQFDPRFSPTVSTLIRQSTNTVLIPLEHIRVEQALFSIGEEIYTRVLEGVIEPNEAMVTLNQEIRNVLSENEN